MDLLNLVDKLETLATTSGKVPGTRKVLECFFVSGHKKIVQMQAKPARAGLET